VDKNFVAYFFGPPCIYAMVVSHCCTVAEVIHFVCLSAACVTCVTLSVYQLDAWQITYNSSPDDFHIQHRVLRSFVLTYQMSFVTLCHTESLCDVHANLYPRHA